MSDDDIGKGVYKPDPAKLQRVFWILSALFFLLAIVSFVGEVRGWWGLLGEVGMFAGTLGGILLGITSLHIGADSHQVDRVHDAVKGTRDAVNRNGETLVSMDSKLGKLDELDVIQAELDTQTGALKHQVQVLEQIRDRV